MYETESGEATAFAVKCAPGEASFVGDLKMTKERKGIIILRVGIEFFFESSFWNEWVLHDYCLK